MVVSLTENDLKCFDGFLFSKDEILKELRSNPFAKLLGYIKENKIVGYLYYSEIYERVEINQLEVQSSNRNCGIASKLMDYLIKLVNKNITLEVREDNLEALTLYEKFQFQKKSVRKGYYQGTDGILMERRVDRCSFYS